MRYSAGNLARIRTVVVLGFCAVGLALFGLLWAKSGGSIPLITGHGYKFSAKFPDLENLGHASDVQMAGVPIGTVQGFSFGPGEVTAHMVLHREGPLHQGATVQIQDKTLIDESYVSVIDGTGPKLKSGTTLPLAATKNFTSLNTVFDSIKPPDQAAAKQLLTEFNSATTGRGQNVNQLLGDLANVGAQGQTVFDVLANQTGDLQQLVRQTGTLLGVLDEGQGQIGDLATSAEQVSRATASSSVALGQSLQELPGVINAAHTASGSIHSISGALTPVAANLQGAAPTLNQALNVLPATTRSLRAILTPLNNALVDAPATLGPLPTTATDVTSLLAPVTNLLSNFNPMVNYFAPYQRDIAAFFSNFDAAAQSHRDANSFYANVEITTLGMSKSFLGLPVPGALPFPTNFQNLYAGIPTNPTPSPGISSTNPIQPGPLPFPHVPQEKY